MTPEASTSLAAANGNPAGCNEFAKRDFANVVSDDVSIAFVSGASVTSYGIFSMLSRTPTSLAGLAVTMSFRDETPKTSCGVRATT